MPAALGGTATGCGGPTSAWRGGTLARRGCVSPGTERVSARPGSISASFDAGRLASTLASAARARASNDFWPRGSFSASLVSVFVCLRGGNAFASFAALRAGCATGASVSCCGARSEEHTSELQSLAYLVCRLLLEKKKKKKIKYKNKKTKKKKTE